MPGVGAFAACMEGLKKVDGDRVIYDRIRAGRPVLGVCVGEQIMFEHGLEHGAHAAGIGLIGGSVNLLDATWCLTWMGHDRGRPRFGAAQRRGERTVLLRALLRRDGSEAGGYVPLRHRSERFARRVSWCSYGRSRFVAAYEHGPLSVTQFHPEKSGDAGSQLLKNWIATL